MTRRIRISIAIVAAIICAVALAAAEVYVKCRLPTSESCVWSRALLRLTVPVYLLVIGVPVGVVVFWIAGRTSDTGRN